MDVRWKHPFTCVIAGPTGCGKTVFVTKFIHHIREIVDPIPDEIVWCFGEFQKGYEALSGIVRFHEGLPNTEDFRDSKRRLIVIDDLMNEADQRISNLFTKGSHHTDSSVIHIVQNLFSKNKEHRTITLNSHYLVIFKNPRDASQIIHLGKQMYPGNQTYLQSAFKDATSVPHGYLLIDLRQTTNDNYRLRTNIFPDERQVVYVKR